MAKTALYMQTYRAKKRNATTPQQRVQAGGSAVATQAPNVSNTYVRAGGVTEISQMSDDELAQLVNDAKAAYLPNQLADQKDLAQAFVYIAGLNGKPLVLDDDDFDDFMLDNGISSGEILARDTNGASYTNQDGTPIRLSADQVSQMLKESRLNYIGGKWGGQALGAGTYFDQNGGISTGYASGVTMTAVLNPETAKVVDHYNMQTLAKSFAQSHPKFTAAMGGVYRISGGEEETIWALAMGYNTITTGNHGYYNVIDRTALVYRKKNS